jgi:O-antigen/teichoic acid export membrane protein
MKIKKRVQDWVGSIISFLNEKGFFHLLTVNVFSQALSFITLMLVAKLLTPAEYGDLKVLQTYVNIFVVVATFGFNSSALKLCSENRTEAERAAIFQNALKRVGVTTTITLAGGVLLSSLGWITSSAFLSKWLIVYLAIVPIDVFTSLLTVYLQAQKRFKKMAQAQAIFRVQSIPLILLGTWIWGFPGFIIASILSHAIGLWPFLRYSGLEIFKKFSINIPRELMRYAIFSFLAQILSQVVTNGDILILDHFSNDRENIGFYSLALLFILAGTLVTQTVRSITTPYFSEHSNDPRWVRTELRKNQLRMIAFSSFILQSSYAILSSAITGLGKMKYTFIIAALSAPLELALTYFSLQRYGFMGVAWSQVVTSLFVLILNILFVQIAIRKQMNISGQSADAQEDHIQPMNL